MVPTRFACSWGAFHRALSDNRERYIEQSRGVMFGLLPERLTDLHALARDVRRAFAEGRRQ